MQFDFPFQYVAVTSVVAVACAYLCHALALRVGLVDKPDERKLHDGHIPLAGGPMVFATFVIAALIFDVPAPVLDFGGWALALLALIFLLGLVDDYTHIEPKLRLGIQAVCGLLMASVGSVTITNVGDLLGFGPILLGVLAIPLTALSFAGLVNAYNMIDGIDGLCASLALLPITVIAVLAWQAGDPSAQLLIVTATSLAVFLVFNLGPGTRWRPKVFLGDSGSGLLGFAVCAVLVHFSQRPHQLIEPVTCLWLVAVPLMDMLVTMAIRVREGHHPMHADRRHLHHLMIDLGVGKAATRRLMTTYAVAMGAVGLALESQPAWVSMGVYLVVFAVHLALANRARKLVRPAEPAAQGGNGQAAPATRAVNGCG